MCLMQGQGGGGGAGGRGRKGVSGLFEWGDGVVGAAWSRTGVCRMRCIGHAERSVRLLAVSWCFA